ncbi:DNA (cytosine-5)-methyltransferase 1 [Pseudoscourfieldia marina]
MSIDCPGIPATRACDVQHRPTAQPHAQNTTTTTTRYCLSCSLSQPQTHDFATAASSDSDCCVTCGEHLADPAIIDLTDDDGFATAVGHAQHNTQQAMPSATPRLTPASRGQQHVSQFLVGKRKRNEKAYQGIDVHVVSEAALAQQRKREWDANINQRHPPLPVPQPWDSTNNTNNDDDEVVPLDRESKSTRAVVRIGARRYVVQSGTILKLKSGGYARFAFAEKVSVKYLIYVHRLVEFEDTLLATSKKYKTTTPHAAHEVGRVEVFAAMSRESIHADSLLQCELHEVRATFGGDPLVRFAYNRDKGDFVDFEHIMEAAWRAAPCGGGGGASPKLRFIDVCCGGGGMSVGLAQAGMLPLAGVDHDRDAVNTYQAMMLRLFQARTTAFWNTMADFKRLLFDPLKNRNLVTTGDSADKQKRLFEMKADADVLVGGIPCQGFSTANPRNGMAPDVDAETRDERNTMYNDYAAIIPQLPSLRFALVEEVPGFAVLAPELMRTAIEMGFQVKVRLMNALHFGCAQNRLRLFVVMARLGEVMPADPTPTHRTWKGESSPQNMGWWANKSRSKNISIKPSSSSSGSSSSSFLKPCKTLEDAIGDLKDKTCQAGHYCQATDAKKAKLMPCHNAKKLGDDDCARWGALEPGKCAVQLPEHLKPADQGAKRRADGSKWHESGRKYGKPQWNEPSATVLTRCDPSHGPYFHPSQCRTFSTRERMRLFEFPDEYNVSSTYTLGPPADKIDTENRIVGNSVPPPLGRAWGESIVAAAAAKTP